MTSSDICNLIKACGESGVRSLRLNGLEITFSDGTNQNHLTDNHISPSLVLRSAPQQTSGIEEVDSEELEDLILSDPAAYEEAVATIDD